MQCCCSSNSSTTATHPLVTSLKLIPVRYYRSFFATNHAEDNTSSLSVNDMRITPRLQYDLQVIVSIRLIRFGQLDYAKLLRNERNFVAIKILDRQECCRYLRSGNRNRTHPEDIFLHI